MALLQAPQGGRVVRVARPVAAPAQRLWSAISAPSYLEYTHPFCTANPVQRWPGTGAADTIHYYGGRVVHRHFTAWEDGVGYDIDVTDADGNAQARVWWRIEADGADASRLTVTLQPRFADRVSRAIRWVPLAYIRHRMKRYLEAVVAGVVHFTETGERVSRNQFGAHGWFSP